MTSVSKRTAYRQTGATATDRGGQRRILVAMEPGCLVLRLKQTRKEFRLPWATAFVLAARAEAEAVRKEKRSNVNRGRLSSA